MSKNQRSTSRVPQKIKSEVSSEDTLTYSTSRNVSNGGVFISTPEPFTPGTDLELSLKLPNGEILTVKGIVRWTRDEGEDGDLAGMGIEFTSLTDAIEKKLSTLTQ